MHYRFATNAISVAARIDQSADEGPTDVDSAPAGRLGAWETTGVVDVSSVFGRDTFLINIQAHTLWMKRPRVTTTSRPQARTTHSSERADSCS